jgi:hypothetical protein
LSQSFHLAVVQENSEAKLPLFITDRITPAATEQKPLIRKKAFYLPLHSKLTVGIHGSVKANI